MSTEDDDLEFSEEGDAALDASSVADFSQAVLYSSDWTVETIISQAKRGNIEMNPRFQRRDAWRVPRKSRFIESIILGLPIPQIVLAEKRGERGKYIVLDGKQRLLSLLQFVGEANGENNKFALSGLEARGDLFRKRYEDISSDPALSNELNAFLNHTLRTVVIRNWPNTDFLHLVFLRLNTGSVKLSPQELRQAVVPGEFSNYVDDAAAGSQEIQTLLSRKTPDPRMRDVELLVRYLALHNFVESYGGRMKTFLDDSCIKFNDDWRKSEAVIKEQVRNFREGTKVLIDIFGEKQIARKQDSRSFNRAIFDALAFYAAEPRIRDAMSHDRDRIVGAYNEVLKNSEFAESIESDTAGLPHTEARLRIWGEALHNIIGLPVKPPQMVDGRISFSGF